MAARLVKQQVLPKEDLIFFFFFFFILKKRPQKSGVADRAGKDYRKKNGGGKGGRGGLRKFIFWSSGFPLVTPQRVLCLLTRGSTVKHREGSVRACVSGFQILKSTTFRWVTVATVGMFLFRVVC